MSSAVVSWLLRVGVVVVCGLVTAQASASELGLLPSLPDGSRPAGVKMSGDASTFMAVRDGVAYRLRGGVWTALANPSQQQVAWLDTISTTGDFAAGAVSWTEGGETFFRSERVVEGAWSVPAGPVDSNNDYWRTRTTHVSGEGTFLSWYQATGFRAWYAERWNGASFEQRTYAHRAKWVLGSGDWSVPAGISRDGRRALIYDSSGMLDCPSISSDTPVSNFVQPAEVQPLYAMRSATPLALSGDGNTAYGRMTWSFALSNPASGEFAFMWTQDGGTSVLLNLPLMDSSVSGFASFDGSLLFLSDNRVYVRSSDQVFSQRDYLLSMGVELTDWQSLAITAISDDGTVLTGTGRVMTAAGLVNEQWTLTIPGPGGLAMGVALVAAVARRRRSLRGA